MTPEPDSLPRIFVAIAAYRDPECQWTVKDIFEKAAHPERIFVGICWQADPVADTDCFIEPSPRQEQTKIALFHPSESKGAGWARNTAISLAEDEEYILMLDAHMRFVKGWDEKLIAQHNACPAQPAMLSASCPDYSPDSGTFQECGGNVTRIRVTMLGGNGDPQPVHLGGHFFPAPPKPFPSAFMVGNFFFARASVFHEVPVDPYLYFYCDEVAYSARLFTHGVNIYQPTKIIAYHQWTRKPKGGGTYKAHQDAQNIRSYKRTMHMLGITPSSDSAVTAELEYYGLGDARPLSAFWEFSGVDLRGATLAEKASKGLWDAPPLTSHQQRIFVQIAAYRDPECQWTVKDMFEKAAHPERIFVGICWQYLKEEDKDCFKVPYPRPDQVRVIDIDARQSKGACWARSLTQSLWRGEEYTLQIDSHMRFEPGWDDTLISMLGQCDSPKPVLTVYPAGYTPPDNLHSGWVFAMRANEFDDGGMLRMSGRAIEQKNAPSRPMRSAFASACFLFAPSKTIEEVPYDPHLYFFGEEITLAARLWTHGWDLFNPHLPVAYHQWERTGRSTHFDDHSEWQRQDRLAKARARHMLGMEPASEPEALIELDRYGLGATRTLAQYEQFSGVSFASKTISDFAKRGEEYPLPPAPALASPAPSFTVGRTMTHQPRKILETPEAIVYDDFLPPDVFEKVYEFACTTDYKHINTDGKVARAWHINDGFPLRSMLNLFYYDDPAKKPAGADYAYPTKTPLDLFAEQIKSLSPNVEKFIGKARTDWENFSSTLWLYQQGTGLSLHDDGSGIYSGAYTFFLSPHWKIHWGGLLLLLDPKINARIKSHKQKQDQVAYYKRKWLDQSEEYDMIWDPGLATCVFPKPNRIVFINNEAYHMVTKVNPDAGDSLRMSIAGFFHKPK